MYYFLNCWHSVICPEDISLLARVPQWLVIKAVGMEMACIDWYLQCFFFVLFFLLKMSSWCLFLPSCPHLMTISRGQQKRTSRETSSLRKLAETLGWERGKGKHRMLLTTTQLTSGSGTGSVRAPRQVFFPCPENAGG